MRNDQTKSARSRFFLIVLFLFLVGFLFISCPQVFSPDFGKPNESAVAPPGYGAFTLRLGGDVGRGRTILPQTPAFSAFTGYTLVFTPSGGGTAITENRTNANLTSDPVILAVGSYDLVVTAFINAAIAARSDSVSVTIGPGTNSASVQLKTLLNEGTGTFAWNITMDTGTVTVSSVTMTIKHSGNVVPSPVTLSNSGPSTGNLDFSSGIYTVEIEMRGTEGGIPMAQTWHELLYVYAGLTSTFTKTFTADYFHTTHWEITFDFNDGSSATAVQSIPNLSNYYTETGNTVPPIPTRAMEEGLYLAPDPVPAGWVPVWNFGRWRDPGGTTWEASNFIAPLNGNITLTAEWALTSGEHRDVSGAAGANIVEKAIAFANTAANASAANAYYLYLSNAAPYNVGAQTINTANFNLTIIGMGGERVIQYNGAVGSRLFTISNETASLTLGNGITLQGITGTSANLVLVSAGTFTMENGSMVTGHTTSNTAAVYVYETNARFVMNGGSISGNTSTATATAASGGVNVSGSAQFTMNGGSITGNTANGIACDVYVQQDAGTVTLSGAAAVGAIRLNATSFAYSSLTLDNWTGATTLDLRGAATTANINTGISYWVGKEVLKGKGTAALSTADVNRFTLGNFFSNDAGHTGTPITELYTIDTGANIGTLVKRPVFVDDGTTETRYASLSAAFAAITGAGTYTVSIAEDQTLTSNISLPANTDITLKARNPAAPVIIDYTGTTTQMFTINTANASLTLDNGITLEGNASSSAYLINVGSSVLSVTFTMKAGSKITGHSTSATNGTVYVTGSNARFIMSGGEISGNSSASTGNSAVGGVNIASSASFVMSGGSITGNTANGIPTDVCFDASAKPSLSGNAELGAVKMFSMAGVTYPSLTLDNWTPPGAAVIHLLGQTSIATVITEWENKEILKAAAGYTLTSADAAKISLGNFYIGGTLATPGQSIADTHKIENTGANIGKLMAKPDGTAGNPFTFSTAAELQKVGSGTGGWTLDAHYIQTANIDLSSVANWTPIGTDTAGGRFSGTYDGGGYTISNLKIDNLGNYQGLFGYIDTGAAVKNLNLAANIKGYQRIGGIAGLNNGTVENCFVTGSVESVISSSEVGGVVGLNSGTVKNSYSSANVKGRNSVGGVVGRSQGGTVTNCYSTGNVEGLDYVGGVVGQLLSSTLQNCVALNPRVAAEFNAIPGVIVTRVAGGSNNMTNNYGRDTMQLFYDWNGATQTGTPFTVTPGPTTKDGADITAGQWGSESWWKTAGNWDTVNGEVWDFVNVWEWNSATNLPILRGFAEAQNHTVLP